MEQVTLKNGMAFHANHANIADFYKSCCTGPNAGDEPEAPRKRLQPDMPGGALTLDWQPTPGLKPIAFDVVSFRRAKPDRTSDLWPAMRREFPPNGDFISYHASPIDSLLMFAYEGARPGSFTITGEPDWVKKDLYDFTAKVAPENVDEWKHLQLIDQRHMVQLMLEETLKVKVHNDTSNHPVYNLVVAKNGPKLTPYHAGDTVSRPGGQPRSGYVLGWFNFLNLVGQDVTMADLVNLLNRPGMTDREVVDKTGLTGTYDFSLLVPARQLPSQVQQAAEDAGAMSVFEAVKQLGLQLVPAKAPVRGIVIDHIERPPED